MQSGEREAVRRLLDAVLTISSELSLPVVLRRIVEAAVGLVDARYGALGVLDETGRGLGEFIFVGLPEDAAGEIGHYPEGHGLLGKLIVDPQPLRLANLHDHPDSYGFPEHHPEMTSFLGVPVRVRGEVFGNLYLTEKNGAGEFSADDEELVVGLAAAAGVAIENARLHSKVSQLLVLEDRERIARDLHDTVIQRLFATGLTLQGAAAKADDPEVTERLDQAVDDLDDTVRHIRSTIFELHRRRLPGRSVRQELLDLIAEAGDAVGADPLVHFDGPIDATLSGTIADHLLAVTREALTNVVKHAQTPRLEVSVMVRPDRLSLVVLDEGVGIDEGAIGDGNGLVNLRARATELGGSFKVERRATGGTRLEWTVPITSES